MKHLWTPWRMTYLRGETRPAEGCLFCQLLAHDQDETNLILHRGQHIAIILNRYPYSNGHVLLVPLQHRASLEDMTADALSQLAVLTQATLRALRTAYSPEGFNVGVNIGEAAGAGIPEHVHTHVLPRWTGDTNFMTTVAETRMIPEDLAVTYRRLRDTLSEYLEA